MKKLVAVLCSVVLIAAVATGCSKGGSSQPSASGSSSAASQSSASQAAQTQEEGDLEKAHVAIKSCEVTADDDGNDIVVIKFDYTNTSDETASFGLSTLVTAFQDGIEMDTAYYSDESVQNGFKDIKPGASLEVAQAFNLSSTSSPVEVEVKDFSYKADKTLSKTFELE